MNEFEIQMRTIRNLMSYAVPENRLAEAEDLLDIYRHDRIALDLLQEFYSFLPDAHNDWVREILLVRRRRGMFLLAAMTETTGYLYLVSGEGVEFQGLLADGPWDRDLLDFFGYSGREQFMEEGSSLDGYQVYEPMDSDQDICPSCHVATGELHELGCPVEVCPWCGGQFIYCSCRYDQLGIDVMESEEDLLRLEQLLNAQGRIPYSPEQRPTFLDDGPGVIID
ncbi:MAG TPA: hypothetical protein DDY20_06225 [Desulfobulbaceae bacterium]|jgi:hypothetical protein|nr:hypothetical protein [Desulfobulbaceae bacterium]